MDLDFNWINLLILFGALQGLLFGIILLFNKKHPGARFLGVFMLVLAYNGFETFNWSAELGKYFLFFDLFPFVMIYAIGPSLYFYIHSLFFPDKRPSWKSILLHYAPVAFQFAFRTVIVASYILLVNNITSDKERHQALLDLYYFYAEPVSVIVFGIYLYLSFRVFVKVRTNHQILSIPKETEQEIRKWVKALLIAMTIMGIAWPLTVLAPYVMDLPIDIHYYPMELALVVFIYWIAFVGYLRMNVILRQSPKTSQNAISSAQAARFMAQLHHAMENDKLYRDPGLNRQKLSGHTGINSKAISATLNQHAQQNFNNFVNGYRVREVCEKLLSTQKQHLTISGIALESGFNSQATFQRTFKNITGMTPRTYQKKQTKKARLSQPLSQTGTRG